MKTLLLILLGIMMGCSRPGAEQNQLDRHDNGRNDMTDKMEKTESEWQQCLSPLQYEILREKGTERPGTGKYYKHHAEGVYVCAACGKELFRSEDKFDSGSGWPSFTAAYSSNAVTEEIDNSLGMARTEVLCPHCGGHLGHVFKDGPQPTGLRYCINSAALGFKAKPRLETATFGAGCFWCVEALYEQLDGIESVKVGYMGGTTENPAYKQVCSGKTGHAEVAQVIFDPNEITYNDLLDLFWKMHDPTTLNRQGADIGTQYRSVIFYNNPEQKSAAEKSLARREEIIEGKIVTEIVPASEFYEAEEYHQDYFKNNADAPYCRMVIVPKLKKLLKQ